MEHKRGYDIGGSHSNVLTIQAFWDASHELVAPHGLRDHSAIILKVQKLQEWPNTGDRRLVKAREDR